MRWSLRYQILAPVAGLILASTLGLSLLQGYLAAESATARVRRRLRDMTATLSESNFPLSVNVLRQMKGLSGADFIVADSDAFILATTPYMDPATLREQLLVASAEPAPGFAATLTLAEHRYFYAASPVRDAPSRVLYVLYPVDALQEARARALGPPLWIGAAALLTAAALAFAVAARVAGPLGSLSEQARKIAEGRFEAIPLPPRNDEVRDLAESIQTMSQRLESFERETRRTERMRTLGQLGGGLAHQLRNAATGARIALDLHRSECESDDHESLSIVERQLRLMERYLQSFLRLGREAPPRREPLELNALAEELLRLVKPTADHHSVNIACLTPPTPTWLDAERAAMEHLMLNLMLNAVEAAGGESPVDPTGAVRLAVTAADDAIEISVADNGPGPSQALSSRMFEPFASDKPDGAGLGLAVAQQAVEAHGGTLRWLRLNGETQFVATLPRRPPEIASA